MTTFEMLQKSITIKKTQGPLTQAYINDTKKKMDVFLMADRISEEEYTQLNELLA